MSGQTDIELLRTLELTLDAYGSDQARWPASRRRELAPLVASNGRARELVREAAAFDRLMASAVDARTPEVPLTLMTRVIAAARADLQPEARSGASTPGGRVIPITSRMAAPRAAVQEGRALAQGWRMWPAIGMLAASLLVGIFVGGSGQLDPAMSGLSEVAGLSQTHEATMSVLPALDSEDLVGEELL